MAWNTCCNFTNASLRASDYNHFTAMRKGSMRLHKAIMDAQALRFPPAPRVVLVVEIRWMPPKSDKPITLDDVKAAVARYYNVGVSDLRAGNRNKTAVRARAVAMTVIHRRGNSYAAIAPWFGFADHTTVRHHILRLVGRLGADEAELIERLAPEIEHETA